MYYVKIQGKCQLNMRVSLCVAISVYDILSNSDQHVADAINTWNVTSITYCDIRCDAKNICIHFLYCIKIFESKIDKLKSNLDLSKS